MKNDKNIYIDIDKVINVFEKDNIKDITQEDINILKQFYSKISISSSFAHKFYKRANEKCSKLLK